MEESELIEYRVEGLGEAVAASGLEWHHLPIIDADVPREPFEERWVRSGARLRDQLACGRRILLHCRGGLGRTGTIAARLLVELGMPPKEAIEAVRKARPNTIETSAQEAHVRSVRPIPPVAGEPDR